MSNRSYEAMFILENNAASADFEGTAAQVDAILEKHGAELVHKEKWDERKLAYEIKGQRRGTYYLTYFHAEPSALDGINEDVHLNEVILRHMVLALDMPIQEHIDTLAAERERLAEDSRKNSLGGWGRRGDRRSSKPSSRSEKGESSRKDDDGGDEAKQDDAKAEEAKQDGGKKDAAKSEEPATAGAASESSTKEGGSDA